MKCLCFILMLVNSLFYAQQNKIEIKIDSLLDQSLQKYANVQVFESFKIANTVLQLSETNKYSRGIAVANIYIAKVLEETGGYKKHSNI